MKKLCIFDLDGTLLDSLVDLKESVNVILKRHSFEEKTLDQIRSYVGNGLYKLLERSVPQTCQPPYLSIQRSSFATFLYNSNSYFTI